MMFSKALASHNTYLSQKHMISTVYISFHSSQPFLCPHSLIFGGKLNDSLTDFLLCTCSFSIVLDSTNFNPFSGPELQFMLPKPRKTIMFWLASNSLLCSLETASKTSNGNYGVYFVFPFSQRSQSCVASCWLSITASYIVFSLITIYSEQASPMPVTLSCYRSPPRAVIYET